MAANPRDERRRRIMNRGADRLALITGRIQSLPHTSSSQTNDLSAHPSFPLADSDVSCHSAGEVEVDKTVKISWVREFRHKRNMWSELGDVHRISVAISASERSRVWCSLAVGVIASLMHTGLLPILGGRDLVKNVIFWRPLLLVLITNLTIFLSHIIIDPRKARNQEEGAIAKDSEGIDMAAAERVSKFLGVGLFLQKVVDAFFMDCSFYSLVLVCALPLCSRCTPPTWWPKNFALHPL